jgi:recombination protein RecA
MRLGQGRDNSKEFLRSNPALMEEIAKQVHDNIVRLNEERNAKNIAASHPAAAPAAPAEEAPAESAPRAARAARAKAVDIEVGE